MSLGNLLRTLVREHTGSWDLKLATVEFAYNTAMNRTTGKSPREIVYDFRHTIDLIPMSDHIRASDFTSSFAYICTTYTRKLWIKLFKVTPTISCEPT